MASPSLGCRSRIVDVVFCPGYVTDTEAVVGSDLTIFRGANLGDRLGDRKHVVLRAEHRRRDRLAKGYGAISGRVRFEFLIAVDDRPAQDFWRPYVGNAPNEFQR